MSAWSVESLAVGQNKYPAKNDLNNEARGPLRTHHTGLHGVGSRWYNDADDDYENTSAAPNT